MVRLLTLVASLGLLAGCASAPTSTPSSGGPPSALTGQVGAQGAFAHLQALQRIADQHGGTRAAGSPGYDASVDYVAQVLRDAGFEVSTPTYQTSSSEDCIPGQGSNADNSNAGNGEAGSPGFPGRPGRNGRPGCDAGRDNNNNSNNDNSNNDNSNGSNNSGGGRVLRNVIAQTRTGDPSRVVMAGAHLDSVQDGPGINDDGSGVATLLEIATHLGSSPALHDAVRFGFWGSEEDDGQGSTGYVRSLSDTDRQHVLVYLNLDMAASPNAGYFVQGGVGKKSSQTGPPGSATAARVLTDQLARTGVTAETVPFTGDDDAAFVQAGIPTGGALTGNDQTMTEQQARAWGGQAGEVFDHCYHSACDRIDNINRDALNRYVQALAGAISYYSAADGRLTN